jgi:hypothetical protein
VTKNALELWEPDKPPKRLATIRGWIEVIYGGIGFFGFLLLSFFWKSHIIRTQHLPWEIYITSFSLLVFVCGILSIYRPLRFIWLNLVLGCIFIATGITFLFWSPVAGNSSMDLGYFPIYALLGFIILYLTIRIRRGLSRLNENKSDTAYSGLK